MTGRRLSLLVVLACLALPVAAQDSLAVSVVMQVISSDPESASLQAAEWADASGGYYTYRSEEQVVLRLPRERVPELRLLIEESDNTLVSYNPSAVDYGEQLRQINAAVNSRNEALNRILAFLETANVSATLEFERELRSLLQEIEYYTGQGRKIQNEIEFATVTVNLASRQSTIPEQRPSNFPWVTTVDLYRFLEEVMQ